MRHTTVISPIICQECIRLATVASYIGLSKPCFSQARRLFRSVEAPSAPMPQRQTTTAAIRAATPVSVNIMPLNTTCPIISTSTTKIALSPLLKMAEINRPIALDAHQHEQDRDKNLHIGIQQQVVLRDVHDAHKAEG